ncbi:MAG: hypothetical protein LQ346_002795 [Caloplaca aetnensis]|nr:MAG: hypothetical protein LQ346_002795 [Caloplaca aetnensis]
MATLSHKHSNQDISRMESIVPNVVVMFQVDERLMLVYSKDIEFEIPYNIIRLNGTARLHLGNDFTASPDGICPSFAVS